MNRKAGYIIALAFILCLVFQIREGCASFYIDDSPQGAATYWGGDEQVVNLPNSDFIGTGYDVSGMTISLDGNQMSVRLDGDYFKTYADYLNTGRTDLDEAIYDPGDLYIASKGWKADNSHAHYASDIFTFHEGWDYVIDWRTGQLYTLTFSDGIDNPIKYTDVSRTGQAHTGGYGDPISVATVNLNLSEYYMEFIFTIDGLDLQDGFGLHWTMACGNDVVEGAVNSPGPVPVPPSVLLLGSGLLGLIGLNYRTKRSVS
ncbi:hypothetical protein [Desulfoferrobacter suflitae]|uniref:hypothetical protein n=1 Tax=Desulfoferrobacter suflitae TaxID=2865782 RepID=UPI0021646957|nr:hypothetical protein [Desulfoferrobacter suflitae]MCK8603903.1 hypothetical protein [Desulfoferrobacter suflitae]